MNWRRSGSLNSSATKSDAVKNPPVPAVKRQAQEDAR